MNGKGTAFWRVGRHVHARERSGKGPLLRWPSGGGGEKEDDREGEEQSTRRAGRVEEKTGGRRDVHYCSTVEGGVSQ